LSSESEQEITKIVRKKRVNVFRCFIVLGLLSAIAESFVCRG
jgi:hypothetical protein